MEQVSGGDQEATEALVLRIAKTLQGSFAKQTNGGVSRKWRDVAPEEKKVWLRLARLAEKTFDEHGTSGAAPATPPATPPIAGDKETIAAPAPRSVAHSADATGTKEAAPVSEATTKPTAPKKASANSAMLRLLGVKPRDDVKK